MAVWFFIVSLYHNKQINTTDMTNTITNIQNRINEITNEFDYTTVSKVVELFNQEGRFNVQPNDTLVDAIRRYTVNLITQACESYNSDEQLDNLNYSDGNFQVDIQVRNSEHKLTLSYVIDEMSAY